jgi:hypothetical protein
VRECVSAVRGPCRGEAPAQERMNSPLELREVRLRGLHGLARGQPVGAGEALFVSRLGARQGFPLSQRRL